MTQEDKDLLLKDLCARLPYGVICLIHDVNSDDYSRSITGNDIDLFSHHLITLKPYLRSMPSMTEEEHTEFWKVIDNYGSDSDAFDGFEVGDDVDWINAHHFDYRDLIKKGLAFEAPEGMYNVKEK